jgi:hypothetical protein
LAQTSALSKPLRVSGPPGAGNALPATLQNLRLPLTLRIHPSLNTENSCIIDPGVELHDSSVAAQFLLHKDTAFV